MIVNYAFSLLSHCPVFSFNQNPRQQASFPSTLKWYEFFYVDNILKKFTCNQKIENTHPLHSRFSINWTKLNKAITVANNNIIGRRRIPGNNTITLNIIIMKTISVFLFLHYVKVNIKINFLFNHIKKAFIYWGPVST